MIKYKTLLNNVHLTRLFMYNSEYLQSLLQKRSDELKDFLFIIKEYKNGILYEISHNLVKTKLEQHKKMLLKQPIENVDFSKEYDIFREELLEIGYSTDGLSDEELYKKIIVPIEDQIFWAPFNLGAGNPN